jgi:hypothetical protein
VTSFSERRRVAYKTPVVEIVAFSDAALIFCESLCAHSVIREASLAIDAALIFAPSV